MDDDTLAVAFQAHREGASCFSRRMAIVLARMDGCKPRQLVERCERLGLLKPGAWQWFLDNGGITADQVHQVLHDLGR
ncbi:hypothetical protein [Bosea minatitlanensis]|uniref:Uncharacterized protein n=1 Tax=Bosea minatitlanensis TaxID=128782 RepID=A0ABW0EW98_9HYPH|nr:hypothetical protein [Bosea minatitlanensis]MCT4496059.1 hypothetical protein [Bosea minatitlanensis]